MSLRRSSGMHRAIGIGDRHHHRSWRLAGHSLLFLPGFVRGTRTSREPKRGPPLWSAASAGLRLPAPRPGLRLALATALPSRRWAGEETEPRRAGFRVWCCGPGSPSLSAARGERDHSALGALRSPLCSPPLGRSGDAPAVS